MNIHIIKYKEKEDMMNIIGNMMKHVYNEESAEYHFVNGSGIPSCIVYIKGGSIRIDEPSQGFMGTAMPKKSILVESTTQGIMKGIEQIIL